MLNLAGVVSGKALGRYRPWIVIGTFVFAAVATPSTDPFSMLFLAVPMLILFLIAEVIARTVDRRTGPHRRQRRPGRRRDLAPVTMARVTPLDAFDLPEWLGEGEVTWTSDDVTRSGSQVGGCLVGSDGPAPPVRPAGRRPGLPGPGRRRRAAHGRAPGLAARPGAPAGPRRPADPRRARHLVHRRHRAGRGHPAGEGRRGSTRVVLRAPEARLGLSRTSLRACPARSRS